eukprot:m.944704 g.944704  ORF g.944704 m.944704 type:complete len:382 (-) comp23843_c0_seq41:3968-5113(-)
MLRQKRREAKGASKFTTAENKKIEKRKYADAGSRRKKSRRVAAHVKQSSTTLEEAVFGFNSLSDTVLDEAEGEAVLDDNADNESTELSVVGAENTLSFVDDRGGDVGLVEESDASEEDSDAVPSAHQSGAAWEDEDDHQVSVNLAAQQRTRKLRDTAKETVVDGVKYAQKLQGQFERVHGKPIWYQEHEEKIVKRNTKRKGISSVAAEDSDSSAESDGDSDSDSEVTATSSKMLARSRQLPLEVLDCTRVRDANTAALSKSAVQAVGFHPTATAMFTAGLDKTLRLFQVDGKVNSLLQSVFFPDLPINSAMFTKQGAEIALSGRRKFFYIYDLVFTGMLAATALMWCAIVLPWRPPVACGGMQRLLVGCITGIVRPLTEHR